MAKIIPLKNGTRRDAITTIAARLFKEKGYSATSMRDLADAIGVEAPSLYNHIGSKKELLQNICSRIAAVFMTNLFEVETSEITVLEKVEAIIRFHIKMMINEYEQVYLSDHEWKHLTEPFLSEYRQKRRNYRRRLGVIIKEGIKELELKDIDPYVVVLTILSAVGGIEGWHRSNKSVDAHTLTEHMVKVLIEGIKR